MHTLAVRIRHALIHYRAPHQKVIALFQFTLSDCRTLLLVEHTNIVENSHSLGIAVGVVQRVNGRRKSVIITYWTLQAGQIWLYIYIDRK